MIKKIFFFLSSFIFISTSLFAAIKTELIDYSSKGDVMQGYVAYDDAMKNPQPAILIVHDWMGLGDFQKEKAQLLAKQGYVAFAVDIYGKGIRPKNSDEAGKLAGKYKEDRPLLRAHILAAFDKLTSMKQVNPDKIVVIGYCFGGMTALELARSGAPIIGTVSFHGALLNPTPENAKNIQGKVLVLHGADDPYVPPSEVNAFKEEMKKGNVKMKFVAYPGAVHAFTNPALGTDNSKGAAYNANADKNSWAEFQKFLKEVFK